MPSLRSHPQTPLAPSDRGPQVERFDYSPVTSEWAVLRLLATLGPDARAPIAARLEVAPGRAGAAVHSAAARACSLERRLLADGRRNDVELLWRAAFAVPLEVLETPEALFKLCAGAFALALPTPGLRHVGSRRLPVAPATHQRRGAVSRPSPGHTAQRFAALATVVVTATSTPAAAFAATAGGSGGATGAAKKAATTVIAPATRDQPRSPRSQSTASHTAQPRSTGSRATQPHATQPSSTASHATQPHAAEPQSTASHATQPHATQPQSTASHAAQSGTAKRKVAVVRMTVPPEQTAAAPDKLVHLFTSPGRSAPVQGAAAPVRTTCTSRAIDGGIAYAIVAPALGAQHNLRVACPGSSPGAAHRSGAKAGSKLSPIAGVPINERASHRRVPHHPAHHAAPVTHPSGGAPLSPPPSTPVPGGSSTPGSSSTSGGSASFSGTGGSVPNSWTGTVAADPALTGSVTDLSGLQSSADRPPSFLIPIYMEAGKRFQVPWEVLAAINSIESDYGRDLSTSSAGAVGWMQFEPSTWRQYGMAVDGHSVPNPYDPRDAIFSAARYLAAAGGAKDISGAVFSYNHASWYVDEVLSRARGIASHVQYEREIVKHGTFSVQFATGASPRTTVRYKGGVLSHFDRLIAAANMVSAANFPYVYGGGHEQPARFAPFDCSGSVSYVMQQAGYKVPTTVSGDIPIWKFPAGPGRVTIFYNPIHTFLRIGDRYFGTSGFARPGGGAGWFDVNKLPASYLAGFREVHVPNLGTNSFAPGSLPPIVSFKPRRASSSNTWASFKSRIHVWMSTLGPFPST